MQQAVDHFRLLEKDVGTLKTFSGQPAELGYFGQEALRFYSIAGSLRTSKMLKNASAGERQISHILGRSLLEGYFWLLYIFEKKDQRSARFQEKLEGFKRDYGKLLNEPLLPQKDKLEPAGAGWASIPRPKDVNSMLTQMTNNLGDKLSYLYFIYRVSSFDTHGNSIEALFQAVFGKECNFPVLDLTFGFDLIANQYVVILEQLRRDGEV